MSEKTFYITTPIFYPNARPHLGHAYTTVITDVMARYHRLQKENTHFLTGTDEHTEKVVREAKKQGKEPERFANENVQTFKKLFADLGISYDQFIRTSDKKIHWPGAIQLWNKLVEAGDIYKAEYEGLYCVGHEAFLTEKDLDAEGKCPDHGTVPEQLKEENYFFRLSKYTKEIKKRIEKDELLILPKERKNEILAFLEKGLEDISFSRPKKKVSWGIPVPGDETQVMYIWCDALSNYITALGYGRDEGGNFETFWPADYHVVGKDILRFHAAIWPAMLISAKLPLPKAILVHGMITSEGRKMSKTLGNVIDPFDLVEKYGTDGARFQLLRNVHPYADTDVTWERLDEWYNAHLANGLGNLTARILKMAETYLDQPVNLPEVIDYTNEQKKLMGICRLDQVIDQIAVLDVMKLDEQITGTEPFKLVKTEEEKAKRIIKDLVIELYKIAFLLEPFMPETSEKIKKAVRENKKPKALFPRKD